MANSCFSSSTSFPRFLTIRCQKTMPRGQGMRQRVIREATYLFHIKCTTLQSVPQHPGTPLVLHRLLGCPPTGVSVGSQQPLILGLFQQGDTSLWVPGSSYSARTVAPFGWFPWSSGCSHGVGHSPHPQNHPNIPADACCLLTAQQAHICTHTRASPWAPAAEHMVSGLWPHHLLSIALVGAALVHQAGRLPTPHANWSPVPPCASLRHMHGTWLKSHYIFVHSLLTCGSLSSIFHKNLALPYFLEMSHLLTCSRPRLCTRTLCGDGSALYVCCPVRAATKAIPQSPAGNTSQDHRLRAKGQERLLSQLWPSTDS